MQVAHPRHRAGACTLNAVGLLPVSGRGDARVAPPCPTTLCVWRRLPYLTLPDYSAYDVQGVSGAERRAPGAAAPGAVAGGSGGAGGAIDGVGGTGGNAKSSSFSQAGGRRRRFNVAEKNSFSRGALETMFFWSPGSQKRQNFGSARPKNQEKNKK